MKQRTLFVFLMAFVAMFSAKAASVMIDVDKAANVTVQTSSGYGQTLPLEDGMNRFDLDDQTDNPLLISPVEGAEIVSITKNETDGIMPSGDGNYRVGFEAGGVMIKIVTSGSGSGGGDVAENITMDFYASGEGIYGKPFTVYYQKDSEWVVPEKGLMDYAVIPKDASVKIIPDKAYQVTGCSVPGSDVVLNGSVQDDGSYVFVNNVPDYFRVQVDMAYRESAIRFSITVDYVANIGCYLENQRDGEMELLSLYDGVKADFAMVDSQNPLEFIPSEGAEILQVLKNGVAQNPIGWNGGNGWVFEVEDGDDFSVSTKGAPTEIVIEAPEGQAGLDGYFFRKDDGSLIELSGRNATYSGNLGEMIYVEARPGTTLSYVLGSNGGVTNMLDNLRVVKGANGESPAVYQIYGSRKDTGVVVSVDDATRVSVLQEGGRGEALQLHDGNNEFSLSDILNSLAVISTEGNQITSVTVNGDNVTVSPNGYYIIEATDGDWIDIKSRKIPVDVTLSFNFDGNADITWLEAVSEGNPVELSNPMTVKSYTSLLFSASDGYELDVMSTETPGVEIEQLAGENRYEVAIVSADVTDAVINVVMSEMQPSEGNSIVIANGDALLVSFWEMTGKDGQFVKAFENNRVNEAKTGNWIRVYCKDSQSEFLYVRVNGEDVELLRNDEGFARTAWVEVKGRTVIDTKVETTCLAYTDRSVDDKKHIQSGNVFIEIDGQRYTQYLVHSGQTIRLVAEPETGYVFDHFEKFYSLTPDYAGIALEGDTYTFTESDVEENFILFKGVFKEDENAKVYVVRGTTAWLLDDDGIPMTGTSAAIGDVIIRMADGSLSREATAVAGQTVHLEISVFDQETVNMYEVAGFCLTNGFPDALIPTDYVVSGDDADAEDTIWISGLVRKKKDVSVDGIAEESGLAYDPASMTVTSSEPVLIYSADGKLAVSSEERLVSVAHLHRGIYVAVSGGRKIKFVR